MTVQSSMFGETTSEDTSSATSSPASGAGRTRSNSRDGKGKSGPEVAPASPSPWQEAEKARLTSGTFGPPGSNSSSNAIPESFSENKLQHKWSLEKRLRDRDYQRVYRRKNRSRDLIRHARFRAHKQQVPFDLDLHAEEIQRRIDLGFCELTGLAFNLDGGRTWDSPSLDRIDPKQGYVIANVRVILHAANSALGDWGEVTMLHLARAVLAKRRDASNALSEKLGKRLKERLATYGSPEYQLTWSRKVTESGHVMYQQRASQRRTSGKGFTGWPTPRTSDTNGAGEHGEGGQDLRTTVQTVGWPTPDTQAGNTRPNKNGGVKMMDLLSDLAGWPTTTTMDHIERAGLRPSRIATGRTGGYIAEVLAGWNTPSARDWKDSDGMSTTGTNPDGSERNRIDQLPRQVFAAVSGWATPTVADAGKITEASHQEGVHQQIYGRPSKSSPAETGSRGALHPAFPCWLMGFPSEWVSCVVSGTP